ncbi:hypothetical protein [Psychromonas algicola]|uniref:hypothetical protein n=1 Tax=Psychromonas algicola TaxID=2555642 RepID=UPI001067EC67|nr:hypothetical protein [Psychromonas sp. RZ5]TEW51937.1 hypothetical protein E2R67_05485 [Psychromonas sp. RZ5]
MRLLVITLLFNIVTANATEYELFDAKVSVDGLCYISINKADKNIVIQPNFSELGQCRLVTHAHTNILNIEYIAGSYLFFIENNIDSNNINNSHCNSEYTAIGISQELAVYTTSLIKKSGSCYQDKELVSFEYFSNKLTVLEN